MICIIANTVLLSVEVGVQRISGRSCLKALYSAAILTPFFLQNANSTGAVEKALDLTFLTIFSIEMVIKLVRPARRQAFSATARQ